MPCNRAQGSLVVAPQPPAPPFQVQTPAKAAQQRLQAQASPTPCSQARQHWARLYRTSQVYRLPLLLPLPLHLLHLTDRVICSLRTLPLYISSSPTFILWGGQASTQAHE